MRHLLNVSGDASVAGNDIYKPADKIEMVLAGE